MGERNKFLPGNKLSVGHGRPKTVLGSHSARKLNKAKLDGYINQYIYMTHKELKTIMDGGADDLTNLEVMIISVIMHAKKYGDYKRLDFLLDRLVGKVIDKVEVATPRPTVIKLLEGGEMHLTSEMVETVEVSNGDGSNEEKKEENREGDGGI